LNRAKPWESNLLTWAFRKPPHESDHSADLWAPELHALHGRWYIYYAAADPAQGNKSHRIYVLGGPPATLDPCSGQWEFLGRMDGMPDHWAIDATVFELENQLYLAYSGWPLNSYEQHRPDDHGRGHPKQHRLSVVNNSKHRDARGDDVTGNLTNDTNHSKDDRMQQLFLMRLDDPSTAGSKPAAISIPQQPWEITRDHNGAHAINEGPQWLCSPEGRWRGLVYSCAGSWTHEWVKLFPIIIT
jgi:GH43 family beta-xylosidase